MSALKKGNRRQVIYIKTNGYRRQGSIIVGPRGRVLQVLVHNKYDTPQLAIVSVNGVQRHAIRLEPHETVKCSYFTGRGLRNKCCIEVTLQELVMVPMMFVVYPRIPNYVSGLGMLLAYALSIEMVEFMVEVIGRRVSSHHLVVEARSR